MCGSMRPMGCSRSCTNRVIVPILELCSFIVLGLLQPGVVGDKKIDRRTKNSRPVRNSDFCPAFLLSATLAGGVVHTVRRLRILCSPSCFSPTPPVLLIFTAIPGYLAIDYIDRNK